MTPSEKLLHVIKLCGDYRTPPNYIQRVVTLKECARHTKSQLLSGNITQVEADEIIEKGQKVIDEIREMAAVKIASRVLL